MKECGKQEKFAQEKCMQSTFSHSMVTDLEALQFSELGPGRENGAFQPSNVAV